MPARRREYAPKPLDPGQPFAWEIPAHSDNGTWVEAAQRTGVIWSAGPGPRLLWVQPDDAPSYPVLVEIPAPSRARWHGPRETRGADWARDAMRRAEAVRARGAVYAVITSTREIRAYNWYDRARVINEYAYHADPDCPDAAGLPWGAPGDYTRYGVNDVVDIVLGRRQENVSPSRLRQRCIWLTVPATSGHTLAA